jgi:bifunctional UDP-N-acetylglucosamine pyrophosphorylase / glucosamine-1-phosphate N-acetyltransferase
MTEDSQASSAARPPRATLHGRPTAAVVLAGGKGTRMRSQRHKVLHPVAGKPMVWHVLTALEQAGIAPEATVVVVGDSAPAVRDAIEGAFGKDRYRFAYQDVPLGTGHATLAARDTVPAGVADVVVAYGDTPLLQGGTIRRLLDVHHQAEGPLTLVTGRVADPTGYGRIVRTGGQVQAVVEERDATPAVRQIQEINSGFCVVSAGWLWARLPAIAPAPNGEIYLTALPATAVAEGATVATYVIDQVVEALGVNTREQLAEAEGILRRRIVQRLLEGGVTIQDPGTTYVDAGVEVPI